MFRFFKKVFVSAMMFFGCNLSNANSLKWVSMSNQECKARPEIININSYEPSFCPYSVKITKCSGSCNNINNPYHMQKCVFLTLLKTNVKVFNLISRANKARHIKLHGTCKCKLN